MDPNNLQEIPIESDETESSKSDDGKDDNATPSRTSFHTSIERLFSMSTTNLTVTDASSESTIFFPRQEEKIFPFLEERWRNHISVPVLKPGAEIESEHNLFFRPEIQCPKIILERRLELEKLLVALYDGYDKRRPGDIEPVTDSSSFSREDVNCYRKESLSKLNLYELHNLMESIQRNLEYVNAKLVKAVKQRAHQINRQEAKCNVITALLQAISEKKYEHTKLHFALYPPTTDLEFQYWINTMKAVAKLPDGIPGRFRAKLWTSLATYYVNKAKINWPSVCRTVFNHRINPDDDRLSLQIIKDLFRTSWSDISDEAEKIRLKRVLLACARYNKSVGYCQGLNVIAALISEITNFNEEITFKIRETDTAEFVLKILRKKLNLFLHLIIFSVLIFLLESILPHGYFDQTLRALSVDMVVMRILLRQRLPQVALHLERLQKKSKCEFEPPLDSAFSLQWFLTLFATCLPKKCVFRIMDAIMLEGSEIILKTSLVFWAKLSRKVLRTKTTNEFYGMMDLQCKAAVHMRQAEINKFIHVIYSLSDLTPASIAQLRDNVTWNIRPFSSSLHLLRQQTRKLLPMFESEDSDHDTAICIHCKADRRETESMRCKLSTLQRQYKDQMQSQKKAVIRMQVFNKTEKKNLCSFVKPTSTITLSDVDAKVRNSGENCEAYKKIPALVRNNSGDDLTMYVTMNGILPVKSIAVQPREADIRRSTFFNLCESSVQPSLEMNRSHGAHRQQPTPFLQNT